ncbi:Cubilin-like protein, partial [Leptotrombidium deliense]
GNSEILICVGYNEACHKDYVIIIEVYSSGREKRLGVYCALLAPGPLIISFDVNAVKILLETDQSGKASGFSAAYNSITYTTLVGGSFEIIDCKFIFLKLDCGQNIFNSVNGLITSPRFPKPYYLKTSVQLVYYCGGKKQNTASF